MNPAIFTSFSNRTQGYLHIKHDRPCEDFCGTQSSPDGRFHIAAVADGHGEQSCLRSADGSRFAVESALACLNEFACSALNGGHPDELLQPHIASAHIKRLTDTIMDRWYKKLHADVEARPLTDEDYQLSGSYAERYRKGERLEHLYGTTLIAALMLPGIMVLLQQGDGRCEVLFSDGRIDQPIPWDERCYQNVTTSLSDSDAAEGFRHAVIDLDVNPIIACYLGSDGVEDSFTEMTGTHAFYIQLSCEIAGRTPEDFDTYLQGILPEFSRKGSGDDVSIAGIVDKQALELRRDAFLEIIRRYQINEEIEALSAKITSMQRKHDILRQRTIRDPENQAFADAYREYDEKYHMLMDRFNALNDSIKNN